MKPRGRRRPAFTLLELIVSLALAAALLAAVGGVVLGVTRRIEAVEDHPDKRPPWADLLASDLRAAASYELTDPATLRLFGPLGRDPKSGLRTHSAGSIAYLVQELDGQAWLCRVARAAGGGQAVGLLCRGRDLRLALYAVPTNDPRGPPIPLPEAGELPDALTVVLTDQSGPAGRGLGRRDVLTSRTVWRWSPLATAAGPPEQPSGQPPATAP